DVDAVGVVGVRVRVLLADAAVRGPAGVPDPREQALAGPPLGDRDAPPAVGQLLAQRAEVADRADGLDPLAGDHGDPGRVVAPVFQPCQARQQQVTDGATAHVANDAAHPFEDTKGVPRAWDAGCTWEPGSPRPVRLLGEAVAARAAVEEVPARTADQDVVAAFAVQQVLAGSADQPVVAGRAAQLVVAGPAVQVVVAEAAEHDVVARVAVVAVAVTRDAFAVDPVVAGPTVDDVGAPARLDLVVSRAAEDDVGFARAGDLVAPARSFDPVAATRSLFFGRVEALAFGAADLGVGSRASEDLQFGRALIAGQLREPGRLGRGGDVDSVVAGFAVDSDRLGTGDRCGAVRGSAGHRLARVRFLDRFAVDCDEPFLAGEDDFVGPGGAVDREGEEIGFLGAFVFDLETFARGGGLRRSQQRRDCQAQPRHAADDRSHAVPPCRTFPR